MCKKVNLPAFKNIKEALAFMEKISPTGRVKLLGKFRCPVCKGLHTITTGPDPGGDSSGTGRSTKIDKKMYVKNFIKKCLA